MGEVVTVGKPVLPVFWTVGVTYRDAWRAMRSMPGVVLATLVAICALHAVRLALGYVPTLASRNLPTSEWLWFRTIIEAFEIAGDLMVVPVLIGVHRWILLGGAGALHWPEFFRSRSLRYFYYAILFSLPSYIIVITSHGQKWGPVLSLPLYLIYVFIAVRGCLIFSAVAIDRPQTRFADLFERTKGNFWRAFSILLLALLPMFASIALTLSVRKLDQPASFVAELLLAGITALGGSALLASANSHIYRFIGSGDGVPRPAQPVEADTADLTA